jgi:ferritin
MLKPKIQESLNGQINAEASSSYLYLSMAAWFEGHNFRGMAAWMQAQAREEWGHAMKLFGFVHARNGRVALKQIDAPKAEWASVLEVFEDSYRHECKITGLIHGLVKQPEAEHDLATISFLQWFINEQVEEEAAVLAIVEKLKFTGESNIGLVILDGELGKRA